MAKNPAWKNSCLKPSALEERLLMKARASFAGSTLAFASRRFLLATASIAVQTPSVFVASISMLSAIVRSLLCASDSILRACETGHAFSRPLQLMMVHTIAPVSLLTR
jgi:hypothetical protein